MNKNIWGHPLDEVSIEALQTHCPPDGYYVAFSGGKDSIVLLDLVRRAEVRYDAHYNLTYVDPPELTRFIRRHYPQVRWERPKRTFLAFLEHCGLPTRVHRECCREFKEHGGSGRLTVTGVRAQESVARRMRGPLERSRSDPSKTFLHPMLNWRHEDVWCYIRERGLAYCSLYDEGWHRLGCVLCPFERNVGRARERWPGLFAAALRAVRRGWAESGWHYPAARKRFATPEAYFDWWLSRDDPYPEPARECSGLFI